MGNSVVGVSLREPLSFSCGGPYLINRRKRPYSIDCFIKCSRTSELFVFLEDSGVGFFRCGVCCLNVICLEAVDQKGFRWIIKAVMKGTFWASYLPGT